MVEIFGLVEVLNLTADLEKTHWERRFLKLFS